MKIYRLALEYTDIGHKEVKSIISVWHMLKDGTIEDKIIKMPDQKSNHPAFFGNNTTNMIAEGRCDFGKKICSCAYHGNGHNQKEWIRSLLKEKFGPDIRIFDF